MYGKNSRFGIMKKLLFVISQLYKGGAETSLVNLLNQLDYSKYSVDLIVLNQVPVKDVVSLLDKVNSNVCVCDAYEKSLHYSFFHLMKKKVLYTAEQNKDYPFSALEFVRNKKYDWAFFVGEWCSGYTVIFQKQVILMKKCILSIWIDLIILFLYHSIHWSLA